MADMEIGAVFSIYNKECEQEALHDILNNGFNLIPNHDVEDEAIIDRNSYTEIKNNLNINNKF